MTNIVSNLLTGGDEDEPTTTLIPEHAKLTVVCNGSSVTGVPFSTVGWGEDAVSVRVHALKADAEPMQLHFTWSGKTWVYVVSSYEYVGTNNVHEDWTTDGYMVITARKP